jgi:hypothetical protein
LAMPARTAPERSWTLARVRGGAIVIGPDPGSGKLGRRRERAGAAPREHGVE